MKPGDIMTIEGNYKPRSFWQWLTRKPRDINGLRQYRIVAEVCDGEILEYKEER